MLKRIALITIIALLSPFAAVAQKGGSHGSSSSRSSTRSSSSAKSPKSTSSTPKSTSTKSSSPSVSKKSKTSAVPKKSTVAPRNSKGKIKRSAAAGKDFMKQSGYPKGKKGYVVDHIVPLECGGADAPSNMQWQTVAEAKIKDRTERNCRRE